MLCNLHTHTTFCDGVSTAEEMVCAAIQKGIRSLGFTGHCLTPFDRSYCMDEEKTALYRAEIARLQQVYGEKIELYCGVEQDCFGTAPIIPYDYAIGSVHYVCKDGIYYPIDESVFEIQKAVAAYGGDPFGLLEDYFQAVVQIGARTQIVGHFDLVTKFLDQMPWFSEEDARYRDMASAALEKLISGGQRRFEINTGAMARGYRSVPYPAAWILHRIQALNGEIVITSDCHNALQLNFGYEAAAALARSCGFSSQTVLCHGQWQQAAL